MKGFTALPVVIILAILVIAGGGIYYYTAEKSAEVTKVTPSPSPLGIPSPSASPSTAPTPTPTAKTTPAATKKATPTPVAKPSVTPTPAPTQASENCPTSSEKGDLVVHIQKYEGSISGDTSVILSNTCPSSDSRLPQKQVIPQGGTMVTFSGYTAGKYHLKIINSGNNYDSDVDIKSGSTPIVFNFPY